MFYEVGSLIHSQRVRYRQLASVELERSSVSLVGNSSCKLVSPQKVVDSKCVAPNSKPFIVQGRPITQGTRISPNPITSTHGIPFHPVSFCRAML